MTESEAKVILERDLNCLKQNKALPDSIESMKIAINALEKQEKIKSIITDKKKQYRQGWEEIEQIVKEL